MVTVDVHASGQVLHAAVNDDGVGGAEVGAGSGLLGLSDRVEALGGCFFLTSPAGKGTTLSIELPLDPQPLGAKTGFPV
jgi:signal transduction histidine kinase